MIQLNGTLLCKCAVGCLVFMICLAHNGAYCQSIPDDPQLRRGMLANGFQYFIRHNPEPENRAIIYLVNKVGSILEKQQEQGLAHFIEHMNFNGMKHYPKKKLEDFLERAGVRFGADLNAYTSHDETVYQLPIPTNLEGMVSSGIGIARDWAADALLEVEQVDKERGVILEEQRLGLGKDHRMRMQYLPLLLNESRYAYRLPIGKASIIKTVTAAELRRFYKDWYRPNLQAIIVVGDVEVDQVENEIIKRFSDLKNPKLERERKNYQIALDGKNHLSIVTDPEQTEMSLNIMIKHKGTALKTEQDYLNRIKRDFLLELLADRYNALNQHSEKTFLQVGASMTALIGGLDAFSFQVVPKPGQLEGAFKQGWRILEQALRFGFTHQELEAVKQNYKRNMEARMKNAGKVHSTSFVQQYLALFLKGTAAPSLSWKYDFMQRHLDGVTTEDLRELLRSYITEINRHYLILCPPDQQTNAPDEKRILSWIREVASENLTAYKQLSVEGELLAERPVGGSIVERTQIESLGVTVVKLSNGATIYLKPTKFQEDQVVFNGFANGGTSLSDSLSYVSAINSAPMISMMGLAEYNPLELQKLLQKKRAFVGTFIGGRYQGVNGNAYKADLETALQLLYLRFTAPRKDTALFNNAISDAKQSLTHKYSNPEAVFRDTIGYVMGGYHYRARPFTVDRIAEINLDQAFNFYKKRFEDAAGFNFVFVGSFEVDSILPLLTTYIGGLPSTFKKETSKDLDIHFPRGRFSKVVKAGLEHKATVELIVNGVYDYNDQSNLGIDFLGQILQSRMVAVLREEASEVYSPSVKVSYNKYPQAHYSLHFSFGCAPENVDHLISLVERELKELRQNGPSKLDIDKVKASYVKQIEDSQNSNGFWLHYISNKLQNKDDLEFVIKWPLLIEKITPFYLRDLAEKYLSGSNLIDFRLLPVE